MKLLLPFFFLFVFNSLIAQSNNSLYFDGVNDYVNLNTLQTDFYNAQNSFTVEFWMKGDHLQQTSSIRTTMFAINGPDDQNKFLMIMGGPLNQDGLLMIYDDGGWGTNTVYTGTDNIGDNQCHHIAYSYDGTNGRVYIDGVLKNTHSADYNFTLQDRYSIGQEYDFADSSQFYNGFIDDFRIWNVVRSGSDILSHMNNQLLGTEQNLIAYYNFDQGNGNTNNAGLDSLNDLTGNGLVGKLHNFTLDGDTSNWVGAPCVLPAELTGIDTVVACDSYVWIDGETYTESSDTNTYVYVGGASNGSDSTVTLLLTIHNSYSETDVISGCDSYTWIDGNTYTSSNNSATMLLSSVSECDSLVSLDLTISYSSSGTDAISACDSLVWIDGNTYTSNNSSATYVIVNGASNGCDSTVTLDLVINSSTTGTDVQSGCDSFTWIDGITYTSSNNDATYTIQGGNIYGCDSVVSLDLSLNYSTIISDVQSACDSYTWIDGNTYTSSNNTATYVIPGGAVNGCDFIVELDLTINDSYNNTDVISACDSLVWIDGNTYTSSNNSATYLMLTAAGCDSLVALDLTVNYTGSGIDPHTACDSYTWVDGNTYTSNNNTATYVIAGGGSNGCDYVLHLDLTILQSAEFIDVHRACESFTWIDGNTYNSSNNTATHVIPGGAANGCDSIIYLEVIIDTVSTTVSIVNTDLIADIGNAQYQWMQCSDSTYSNIPGEINQSFTPPDSGYYAVIITKNSCTDTSECVSLLSAGIYGETTVTGFEIFPNPSAGLFIVQSELDNPLNYSIVDIYGRIISASGILQKGNNTIDCSQLSNGTYLIRIDTSDGVIFKKLILQH